MNQQSKRAWVVMNRPGDRRWLALGRRGDRGSVTAELAVALPVFLLLLLAGLTSVSAVATKLRCVDAAREAARAEARGESGVAAGERAAPAEVVITIDGEGDMVRATVRTVVRPLGGRLPGLRVEAYAVAAREPDEAP
jgi:Flp pilus assembly protein TadG